MHTAEPHITPYTWFTGSSQVDQYVSAAHFYEVVDDWDCMLNQTNIGQNNNKYYVIQMLKSRNGTYNVWNRWGRVVSLVCVWCWQECLS